MSIKTGILAFVIIATFCLSRLYQLSSLPMFMDEALYLRWTEAIAADWRQYLLPLQEDGQPPLFFWMAALGRRIWAGMDTLVWLRMLSVVFGGLTLLTGSLLIYELSRSRLATISFGLLYICLPFTLWYDRLGMRDSAMSLVLMTSTYGLVTWQRTKQPRWLMLVGSALAFGIWVKSLAWLAGLAALVYLVLARPRISLRQSFYLISPLAVAVVLLLMTGLAQSVAAKNTIFVTALNPSLLRNNLYQVGTWLWDYMTGVPLILLLAGIVWQLKNKHQTLTLMLVVFSVPLLIELVIAQIFFPRYFLMTVVGYLVILALLFARLHQQTSSRVTSIVLMLTLVGPTMLSLKLITNPVVARMPDIERWQYISGWPAGYGVAETADFLMHQQVDFILTETSDLLRTGLPYYQKGLQNKIRPLSNLVEPTHADRQTITSLLEPDHLVYLGLHLQQDLPAWLEGEKIYAYQKPNEGDQIKIFRLNAVKE